MQDLDKIISDNIGLVYKQLHSFNRANDNDAFSYALEALGKAAETYDKSKSVAFSTYATACIYNKMLWYLRESARQAKAPVVHFEDKLYEGTDICVGDTISTTDTPELFYLKKEYMEVLWDMFDEAIKELPNDVSKNIINFWRASDFTARQQEISKELGVSQAHVSRTLSAFKHKLKLKMEGY